MAKYISSSDLENSVRALHGTAHHLFKIWLVLKEMGLSENSKVSITTGNSTDALNKLFSYGSPDNKFYIPFAHTKRFKTMMHDASRSIIQTTIQRWFASGSVVEVDPTNYLNIEKQEDGSLIVSMGKNYPKGLGYGNNGFALDENARVTIPEKAFSAWYFRETELPDDINEEKILDRLKKDLNISPAEYAAIFSTENDIQLGFSDNRLSKEAIYEIVSQAEDIAEEKKIIREDYTSYMEEISNFTTINNKPKWLNIDPKEKLKSLLDSNTKNVLLYGPPRTGKSYTILELVPEGDRVTIQMHDGWTYEDLVIGLMPMEGTWAYKKGPLLEAILGDKKYIIIEEINRTDFINAIGDVFSLLEEDYRDGKAKVVLKDGSELKIPSDKVFIFTMNTLDKSVTIIDDALFGRVASVEYPPRVEDLEILLSKNEIDDAEKQKIRELFNFINNSYPLGHAFFADYKKGPLFTEYYAGRIRPVLQKHLEKLRQSELDAIDEKVDQLFNSK